jgi:two-component system sensor histidine kinase UhpB
MSALDPTTLSDRVYRTLLVVYPAAHRRAYGPSMAQVFRDLCRDAQLQAGAWGLVALWLRTLLDLSVTAVTEHWYEKGRDHMASILETQGLGPALTDFSRQLTETAPFEVHFTIKGALPRLTEAAETTIYDLVQEAVSNATRHAQANNLWIALRCGEDEIAVSVRDDGAGFDLDKWKTEMATRGADPEAGMHGRAEALGGNLAVESAVGAGTTVRFASPLSPNLRGGA